MLWSVGPSYRTQAGVAKTVFPVGALPSLEGGRPFPRRPLRPQAGRKPLCLPLLVPSYTEPPGAESVWNTRRGPPQSGGRVPRRPSRPLIGSTVEAPQRTRVLWGFARPQGVALTSISTASGSRRFQLEQCSWLPPGHTHPLQFGDAHRPAKNKNSPPRGCGLTALLAEASNGQAVAAR